MSSTLYPFPSHSRSRSFHRQQQGQSPPPPPSSVPSRTPSSPSDDPDDSSDLHDHRPSPQHHQQPGIGRKVAASLQLFKQSEHGAPSDAIAPPPDEEVHQAQFVKRAEWPDRETSQRKNSSAFERTRTRDEPQVSLQSDDLLRHPDILPLTRRVSPSENQWEVVTDNGGLIEIPSPPSPCSSLSTTVTLLERHRRGSSSRPPPQPQYAKSSPRSRASPTITANRPAQPHHRTPPPNSISGRRDQTPYSPWTTDDETWDDSASASTFSTATTSARPQSPDLDDYDSHHTPPSLRHVPSPASTPARRTQSPDDDMRADSGDELFDLQTRVGRLPHVPLRPFRNQVGGHSAIYKFTKRAVCKARVLLLFALSLLGI